MSFATLPALQLTWTAPSLAGGDTFVQYNVYRRLTGTTAWQRIAVSTTGIGTVTYTDYTVASAQSYDYTVTLTVLRSGVYIEAAVPGSSVTRSCTFTSLFLHDVASPTNYVELLGNARTMDDYQDQTLVQAWARPTPTMYVGEAQSRHWEVTSIPYVLADQSNYSGIDGLLTRQRTNASIMCYRDGVTGERAFAVISGESRRAGSSGRGGTIALSRTDNVSTYQSKLLIIESYYTDTV